MSGTVAGALLFAALLHASWNAIVKSGHVLYGTALVSTGAAVAAAMILPFCPLPAAASWPFIVASSLVAVVYYVMLVATYREGDVSFAYPLMRGSAPLLVALASIPLGERLQPAQWLAIATICGGILTLCVGERRRRAPGGRTLPYALLTACLIAACLLLDGAGVRRSGAPMSYGLWVFVLTGIGFLAYAQWGRRLELRAYARANRRAFVWGGLGNLGSYGIALWAMTRAPVAAVAALHETSILFSTIIATLILREKIGRTRFAAAAAIACGAALMHLA